MADRVHLRREPAATEERGVLGLVLLFLVIATVLLARAWWTPHPARGLLVEVSGQVAAPGTYLVDPPTLAAAVEAAGGIADGVPETPLFAGDGVWVSPDGVRVVPTGQPLLVALPVDVNVNGADALAAVPGLGARLAEAIVADRDARGPFHTLDELARVSGLGGDRLDEVTPFLTVGSIGPRPPVDVNLADAVALESLPGVGPVLAQRIVDDRASRGRFATLDDLDRVSGVGPALVDKLRAHAVAGSAP
ncbi:MAG: helix-hairpin-helix domain-containing protein [Alphaproteobacteria bacterium]|nr:helix-hairpin-helix domain-containing protein [Alphaproteobacteria bacterium]